MSLPATKKSENRSPYDSIFDDIIQLFQRASAKLEEAISLTKKAVEKNGNFIDKEGSG